jgi:hypothetical protein
MLADQSRMRQKGTSCMLQTIGFSANNCHCHSHILLQPYANFGNRKSDRVIMANQWVWCGLPVVNSLHSNDEWIGQWEGCFKFKVLNPAAINTSCVSRSVGSRHFGFTFQQVWSYFGAAPNLISFVKFHIYTFNADASTHLGEHSLCSLNYSIALNIFNKN